MTVEFDEVRYIKLGKGGCWSDISLDRSEIHFGFGTVSHEMATRKNIDEIRQHQAALGRKGNAASDDAREVLTFYSMGRECLWITFARGHLWWTFSAPEVTWIGGDSSGRDSPEHGFRVRKCDGWRKLDENGDPLRIDGLSTSLTQVAAYRRTICRVESSEDYLRRRINGIKDPLVEQAKSAGDAMLGILDRAIAKLHQTDFETLADVMFARSGWHRVTALGGAQEFIDLALEQPATGERAAVQVKSQADQSVLDDYITQYAEAGSYSRLFFVCHTATPPISSSRSDVLVWQGRSLSEKVMNLGLANWVLERIA
jgi:hypothetical protein